MAFPSLLLFVDNLSVRAVVSVAMAFPQNLGRYRQALGLQYNPNGWRFQPQPCKGLGLAVPTPDLHLCHRNGNDRSDLFVSLF